MKKICVILLFVFGFVLSLAGCANTEKYTLSFISGNDVSEKIIYEYNPGEKINLPDNSFSFDEHLFVGWTYDEKTYQSGDEFIMPEHDVEMVAKWELVVVIPNPTFSQDEYEYDRISGGNLELPFDLDGATIYYINLDGEPIISSSFSYNDETKCLVVNEEVILNLQIGAHELIVIMDVEKDEPIKCIVNVTQSLQTSFDEETTKLFTYGIDEGVTFTVDFNTTVPEKLVSNDAVIDEKYYSYNETSFTVSSELLKYFSNPTTYKLYLSNNDVYEFNIITNIVFATDYDKETIHDTTASNVGVNSLYQYYDNISIVDGPEGMDGKVLKFTPNIKDVTYDCHAIYTLRKETWDSTWYKVSIQDDKYYSISFDYMTIGTSTGEFYFKNRQGSKIDIPLGNEVDGVVRSFSTVLKGSEISSAIFVWAFFKDAGGHIYFDNYKLVELDCIPEISIDTDCGMSGDYYINFNSNGYDFETLLNGSPITTSYNDESKKLVLSEEDLISLNTGTHTITISTIIGDFSDTFNKVDDRVANLTQTTMDVIHNQGDVKLAGEFSNDLHIVSITRYGSDTSWDKTATTLNNDYITIENDGIVLSSELVNLVYKTTRFEVELDNGKLLEFSLTSNIVYYTDYDQANVFIDLPGSSVISHDRNMFSRVDTGDGDYKLKYEPAKAKVQMAVNAINGNGFANSILSFRNKNKTTIQWYSIDYSDSDVVYVSFEYEIVTGGKDSYYCFSWWDASETRHAEMLSGSGVFTFIKPANQVARFSISCPVSSPNLVTDTYMLIDNFAVGRYKETTSSTETMKLASSTTNDQTINTNLYFVRKKMNLEIKI